MSSYALKGFPFHHRNIPERGADLANLLNEGAIMAARKAKTEMDSDDAWHIFAVENHELPSSFGCEKSDDT